MDKKTVATLLDGMSQEELIKVIIKLANYSEKGERWLLEHCKKMVIKRITPSIGV